MRLPHGPLTATSFHFGWFFMITGLFVILLPLLPDQLIIVSTTREFMQDIPNWVFGILMFVSGFFIAKPGCMYRRLKALGGMFGCVMWIGACMWPLVTQSGNPVSVIGVLLWTMLGSLIYNDSFALVYDHDHCKEGHCNHLIDQHD